MTFTLLEAIPEMPVRLHNCLLRNGVYTWEHFGSMTDLDLLKLKGALPLDEMICYRDKAKYYKEFQEKRQADLRALEEGKE